MRNISPASIFSELIKRKVRINVVLTSHVLLICLKLCCTMNKITLIQNISPAIIFSKLIKRKVKNNVVLTSHVLLICLKSILHYELNYPVTNMLSHTLI